MSSSYGGSRNGAIDKEGDEQGQNSQNDSQHDQKYSDRHSPHRTARRDGKTSEVALGNVQTPAMAVLELDQAPSAAGQAHRFSFSRSCDV
jgi:hypothetical protein